MDFWQERLLPVIKKSDSAILNATKAVSMFLDDSGHHNLIARSISVANID